MSIKKACLLALVFAAGALNGALHGETNNISVEMEYREVPEARFFHDLMMYERAYEFALVSFRRENVPLVGGDFYLEAEASGTGAVNNAMNEIIKTFICGSQERGVLVIAFVKNKVRNAIEVRSAEYASSVNNYMSLVFSMR